MRVILFCLIAVAIPAGAAAQSDTLSARAVVESSLAMFKAPRNDILRAAEKMPEEHYGFRPTPEVRTFAEILGHIADGHYLVCSKSLGEKPPNADIQFNEKTKRTKAELVRVLTESAEYCDRAHAQLAGPRGAEVIDWFGAKHPRATTLFFNTGHDWESYGTLVAYMRMKGIVPPSSEPRTPPQPPPAPPQDPAHPAIGMVDTPSVRLLRGFNVREFETEMQLMNQALGVGCGYCHTRGNFASDENPRKNASRTMIELTRTINQQFFPAHRVADGASRLGKVTCFTCHQGNDRPKAPPEY